MSFNSLIATLNRRATDHHYSNIVIGTYMAVDGWAVTFGTARRGLGGAASRPWPLLAVLLFVVWLQQYCDNGPVHK